MSSNVFNWLSSRNFFQGGKIYCYANFSCYAIVFGPNFREGQKFSGGQTASGGRAGDTSVQIVNIRCLNLKFSKDSCIKKIACHELQKSSPLAALGSNAVCRFH